MQKVFSSSFRLGIVLTVYKLALYFLYIFSQSTLRSGFVFVPDFTELVTPIDHLIDSGTYALEPNGAPFTGRLPGFIFPYILFRLVFSAKVSVFLLGLFIVCCSVLASVLLIRFIFEKTKSVQNTAVAAILYLLFPFYWHWDFTIHPNSLSVSFSIFSILAFNRLLAGFSVRYAFSCGFFLAWVFMLRGFTFLFLPLAAAVIAYIMWQKAESLRSISKVLLCLILPFIVFEGAWILRNAMSVKKFIPLQTSFVPGGSNQTYYSYSSVTKGSMMDLRDLVSCWGGDNFWYFKGADMAWFVSKEEKQTPKQQFKTIVFESGITEDDLISLKSTIINSFQNNWSLKQHDSLESSISIKSKELQGRFMANSKWYYFTTSPFSRVKNFLLKNVTQDWPGGGYAGNSILKKLIKIASLFCFAFVLLMGLLSNVLVVLRQIKDATITVLVLFGNALIVLFAVSNTCHYSYFMIGYFCFGVAGLLAIDKFRKNRLEKSTSIEK